MKKNKNTQSVIQATASLAVCLMALAACAPRTTDSSDSTATSAASTTPFGTTASPGTGSNDVTTAGGTSQFSGTGATANLNIVSNSTFSDFLLRPWDNQSGFQVYVGTHSMPDGSFAGEVQIGYTENGVFQADAFDSGEGTVANSDYGDKNKYDSAFNKWFPYQGKTVAHGFFQDQYGALVLVITGNDAGASSDGTASTTLSGEIWYKNFKVRQMLDTGASQFLPYVGGEQCWFVGIGPWSCRTFLVKNKKKNKMVTDTDSALYPSNNYQKLGTFTGLDKTAAFQ